MRAIALAVSTVRPTFGVEKSIAFQATSCVALLKEESLRCGFSEFPRVGDADPENRMVVTPCPRYDGLLAEAASCCKVC